MRLTVKRSNIRTAILGGLLLILYPAVLLAQNLKENPELDKQVETFLEEKSGSWRDMNVPTRDALHLYDLIIQGNYKSALEIGTSTGYSGIYIAWALSKTGGKLITIDIDEGRHKIAMENFRESGLSDYVDARLADAHQLVTELEGPFDFVFSDADKSWYKNYFLELHPKLVTGGCYATHNISKSGWNRDYYNYITGLDTYKSTLKSDGGGLLISIKKAE